MSVFSKILENLAQGINKELDKHALKNTSQNASQNLNKEATKKATQKVSQNTIKGENFTTTQNNTPSKSDYTANITLESWVRQVAGIHPSKQVKADLEALYKKHPEMFAKPSEVYKLINEVKSNPQFFYTNNQPNIALIGKMLENGKLGKIGIQKDYESEFLSIRHATTTSANKAQKENARLQKKSDYPLVERSNPTQQTSTQGVLPTTDGANARLKDNQHNSTKNQPQKQESNKQDSTQNLLDSITLTNDNPPTKLPPKLPPMMRE